MSQNKKTPGNLVTKQIPFPSSWLERIDKARAEGESFSAFVRRCVAAHIDTAGLEDVRWGGARESAGRPASK
jgi:hypothetical protein